MTTGSPRVRRTASAISSLEVREAELHKLAKRLTEQGTHSTARQNPYAAEPGSDLDPMLLARRMLYSVLSTLPAGTECARLPQALASGATLVIEVPAFDLQCVR
ncbi:uncharacterized protein P174DRAFT_424713 [Aspergillus novofumigatus IBT 16806]|uniref:Uncharacterized protein n=1 Tax=Aspergillus novofumigatus (strain IBT 16806) TaxID=1392255 RepID=A0A2I1BVW7_ASPN1|nr:uncharacterized protein P174DRAFT_424713 [Aspergillus novofumigatus IBT 16806]PKX89527.1 hypothetical protein P174DRAFT_424713 [Aspergillus novofumigatus IBT 16806]